MLRRVVVALALIMVVSTGIAQTCNPVIDGTYCATQNFRGVTEAGYSTPFQSLGASISASGPYDQPATLGAITFSGGTNCIGLLRRVKCK